MKQVKLGLCGLGTVGGGVLEVLKRNQIDINARAGREVVVTHVGARKDYPHLDLSKIKVSRNLHDVATDPDIDIFVELIGGTGLAKELVLSALRSGKHVVTANKALIAEHGNELFTEATQNKVTIAYESAVAGGIPIIQILREGLVANKIEWLAGIINGTGNYILTEMRDRKREFSEALKDAQELGYAEADPTFDVEGIDAAHKLSILASIAFGMPLHCDKVFTEGISKISPEDVVFAEELGYRIKHLGIARNRPNKGIEMRVHPTLIPETRLLANVNGVKNAVLVKCDALGSSLYYGAGAGAEPTASAVISDIVDIGRSLGNDINAFVPPLGFTTGKLCDFVILPIEEVESAHYLRVSVLDKPGVLSRIATIFSDLGISIEALIQREPREGQDHVPLIMLTTVTREKLIMDAVEKMENLEFVRDRVTRIRVESLK